MTSKPGTIRERIPAPAITRMAQRLLSRALVATGLFVLAMQAPVEAGVKFKRIPTQFVAALGDPQATAGSGAETWGLWRVDPGPRGVWIKNYQTMTAANGGGPAKWQFDNEDWWLDENGLLMEKPDFAFPPGQYVVTGDRETVSVLTVHPKDKDGAMRWELGNGATLHDVTHLPCRSARYTPATFANSCSPAKAHLSAFPVTPGGTMPSVEGCKKLDYSVLFVIGVAVQD